MATLDSDTAHLKDFYRYAAARRGPGELGAIFNLKGVDFNVLPSLSHDPRALEALVRREKERAEKDDKKAEDERNFDFLLLDIARENMIRQMEEDLDRLEGLHRQIAENRKALAALAAGLIKDENGAIDYAFYAQSRLDPLETLRQPGESDAAYRARMRDGLVKASLDEDGKALQDEPLSKCLEKEEENRRLEAEIDTLEDKISDRLNNMPDAPENLKARFEKLQDEFGLLDSNEKQHVESSISPKIENEVTPPSANIVPKI